MPKCFICGKDKPYQTEDFLLLREYKKTHGEFWYFCSVSCLWRWLYPRLPSENAKPKIFIKPEWKEVE